MDVIEKLLELSANISTWSQHLNRDLKDKIASIKDQIDRLRHKTDPQHILQVHELKEALSNFLAQNEVFWKQRAKQHWLKAGDLNTKFFHSMATRRKERNRIRNLFDETGTIYDDNQELCRIAHDYFENLFKPSEAQYDPVMTQIHSKVTEEDNSILLAPFTAEEFRSALFQMHPDKAPGPEGYNPAFFQRF